VARLVGVEERPKRREPGSAKGTLTYSDDFDAPLPEEVLNSFER
jgi:antitoxin (DNA-binding transcriptional repressor) of toxin-antitoxin stability system